MRRAGLFALALLVLGAATVLLFWPGGREASTPREVTLGVNEVLSIDGDDDLLRLTTLAKDAAGNYRLHFADAAGQPNAALVQTGEPLPYRGRTITLVEVRRDRERGGAVQLQWIPEGAEEPGPLFTVGEDPVPLPVPDSPFTVVLAGAAPAPGSGPRTTRLRVADEGRLLVEGAIVAGEALEVPGHGELRWLGTQERYVVRLRID